MPYVFELSALVNTAPYYEVVSLFHTHLSLFEASTSPGVS